MEDKYVITYRSVMGSLADCAVRQSPYPVSENLEMVLGKFHGLIESELNEEVKQYILKFDSWNECHEWIASRLKQIPEYLAWNERKNGNQALYKFTSAYDGKGDPDNDFIDLDALSRNITNMALCD